jgi:hypothetical protein
MKWVADSTNRFEQRPYYDQAELDSECEGMIRTFLMNKNGRVNYPVSTDDLSIMLEGDTSDLDLFADLSYIANDVEGVTDFFPDKKPAVRIARELSFDEHKYHRLRTTLAHEYGHVHFHAFLWDFNRAKEPALKMPKKLNRNSHRFNQLRRSFLPSPGLKNSRRAKIPESKPGSGSCFSCYRDLMLDAPFDDWMEWQAGYAGGALLMPLSTLQNLVASLTGHGESQWVPADSEKARELTARTAANFDVSTEAACVRLLKLGFLQIVS